MLSDACKVMSSVRCLERVFAVLQTQLPELAAAPAQRWRQVEGCVYCMRQMVAANRVQDPAFFGAEVVGSTAGWRPPSALLDDRAPSASVDRLEAAGAPTHPGAPPRPIRDAPWPQELAFA